jgi:hydrogenase nickel incorporation protein HypA/HybF
VSPLGGWPAADRSMMHEIGLCEGVVAAVERRAAGRRVTRVKVRAGALLRIVEPSMAQAFAMLAAGTVAEDARVDLVQVPAQADCDACGYQGSTTDALATCPGCGGGELRLSGGEELVLESVTFAGATEATEAAAAG